jgi:hypothetical protein
MRLGTCVEVDDGERRPFLGTIVEVLERGHSYLVSRGCPPRAKRGGNLVTRDEMSWVSGPKRKKRR